MRKILFALTLLCFSTPAFALDPTGTGYVNGICAKDLPRVVQNGYVLTARVYRPCKKITFNPIGIRLDAGGPDGLGFSLIGRPLKFAQLELGGTTTLVGGGVRVGASIFLPWYVSPSAHVEYGHQWAGDVSKLIVMMGGRDPNISLLKHVEYDYVNLHGGLGFGHPNWFMFRIQAGYSYLWGATRGLQLYMQGKTNQPNLTAAEAYAKIWTPSAKISFDVYF